MQLARTDLGDGSRRALLVHGLNGDGGIWWRIADALAADGWSVTTIDLRGHGASPAADSYAFADYGDDLPLEQWDLVVAHSLGGAVSLDLASREPSFTQRLALLDPTMSIPDADRAEVLDEQIAELADDEASVRAARPHWHERDVAAKLAAVRRSSERMIRGTFADNDPWDVRAASALVDVPVLVLAGDPDVFTFTPVEHVAAVPSLTFVVVEGAGHSPHRDRPDETIAALRAWIATT